MKIFGLSAVALLPLAALGQESNSTMLVPRAAHSSAQAYIVHFAPRTSRTARQAHINWLRTWTKTDGHGQVTQGLKYTFDQSLSGYSAIMNAATVKELSGRPDISHMAPVAVALTTHAAQLQSQKKALPRPQPLVKSSALPAAKSAQLAMSRQTPHVKTVASALMISRNRGWNAARISHRSWMPGYYTGSYVHNTYLGQGTQVYVLDSGVSTLKAFSDTRITIGKNFVRGTKNEDISGHGTMVAALVSSRDFGLAPGAQVTSLKVSNDNNVVSSDDLIAALEYVMAQPGQNNMKIISLSQYFRVNPTVNRAFEAASRSGVHIIVAAGNDGADACGFSPGVLSKTSAIVTVGSIDGRNMIPIKGRDGNLEGSNTGPCVSLYAPGSKVPTLSNKALPPRTSYYGYGTSVATPQVAAIAAVTLSQMGPMSPAELKRVLVEKTIRGQIVGTTSGSPGGILWNGLA